MPVPSTVHQEDYANFLAEASDLLQTIEQELFNLKYDRTPARVHTLMRSAHTLKGSAASVQLETVKSVAHVLEDVFRSLYNPEVVIDAELESLLFQAYECLRIPLMAEFTDSHVDAADVLGRTATILSQLQAKLGDLFDQETPIPTSSELGFDIVLSMFEGGVEQRLQALEQALTQPQLTTLATQLQSEVEIFLGLAESVQLPGFAAIAQTTLQALATHPDQVKQIATLAIADFRRGQAAILAGDRTQGGTPSPALTQLTQPQPTLTPPIHASRERAQPQPIQNQQVATEFLTEPLFPTQPTVEKKPKSLLKRLKEMFVLAAIEDAERDWDPSPASASSTTAKCSPKSSSDVAAELPLSAIAPEVPLSPIPSPFDLHPDFSLPDQSLPEADLTDAPFALDLDLLPPDQRVSEGSPIAAPFDRQADLAQRDLHLPDELEPETPVTPAHSSQLPDSPTAPSPSLTPDPVVSSPANAIASRWTDLAPGEPAPAASSAAPLPVVRVRLEQLERLDYLAGELLINQNQQTTQDDGLRLATQELLASLQKHKRTLSRLQSWSDLTLAANGALSQAFTSGMAADFDALEMDRYTDFHVLVQSALNDLVQLEMVGESLETQIQQVRQSRETQKRLLTSMQDDLTTARMQPLGETLNRLPRVLQQLAIAHGKAIDLSLSGTDILVDKAIAEKLYNPLLHLVRNAFDHGIESSDARRANGKPETGQIHIHAYHQGNRTLIEVQDDGKGIDWQRVAEKAIESGRVDQDKAPLLTPSELAEFLFQAGFSTAVQVSDLSGRGVGLDMVRSEMQSLKGTISVSSVAGQGTTFTLSLPMSFSITRLMICQERGVTYALPINTVQQVVLPQPHQLIQSSGQQMALCWHSDQGEQMIPVQPLSGFFNDSNSNSRQKSPAPQSAIILLRAGQELWGLSVDQVMGEQELVIRPLGSACTPPPYVYGCSMLSDRQMALVIDPILLQKFHSTQSAPLATDSAQSTTIHRPTTPPPATHILLIEDSLTVRHSLARTLQEQGYRVSQAGDGLEGFAFLQQAPDVNLIISDIEMPRMNGFEFLSQLRKTPVMQTLPVVLLTSRSSSKYRQFADNLGANAFINKPYSTDVLLPLLANLINSTALVSNSR